MEKIAIVMDSTAYLPDELTKELNIRTVYLNIVIDGNSYKEVIDMPLDKYYDYLKDPNNSFPTTSQPAIGEVVSCLEKLKEEGYTDVIAIALSSGISGTFSSYSVADLMVDGINVYPFDSEVACHPEGYYAIKAAGLIKEGKSSKEIIATLDEMKKVSKAYFMADDLSHLQRSGRLNGAQAIVGNLLQVKPLLHFEDKVIVPFQKIRTYKKVVLRIYELFDEFYRQHKDENISVCILHVDALEKAEEIKNYMKEVYPNVNVEIDAITPVVSTHLGIGAIGFAWTIL
ncbi:MAG: DegV family protein [Gemella morbillorum]|uniref:DegV family EDD domain-containing protein n=1 Tax=Gemella morbillorum TaxID=29391 RepID=A0AAP9HDJ1_9BACL|nr:DegV family protein [Gemella morbillorum]MDK8240061.1 DegV family protein [Gemella morbillorum]MDK8255243.1 DegV family protein [Gemella morbillorum]QGS09362.1 DegV family EDD domain-containing protein [Gemella morbillorum]